MSPDPFNPATATSPPPAPAAPATSPPPPAPAPVSTPAVGSGASGSPGAGSPQPSAVSPPPAAAPTGAAAQPLPASTVRTFDDEFRTRYGMDPGQAQLLMTLGYSQYTAARQPTAAPAAAPAAAETTNPFGLPAFDYRLLDFIQKDPQTGQYTLMPGAPPDALIRVQDFQDKLRQVQQKFWSNPTEFLAPLIQAEAKKVAEQLYKDQFGGYRTQEVAHRILEDNSSWLFEKDANGQPLTQFDPASGQQRRVASAWGKFYHQCVSNIVAAGVTDPQQTHDMAMAQVENAAYKIKAQQGAAGAAGAAAASNFLAGAAANPPAAAPAPAVTIPAQPATTLRERMHKAFEANGITDSALATQLRR